MYAANVIHQHWLWSLKFTLEGIVASEVGIPGLPHSPTCRSPIEYGLGIQGAKQWALLILSTPPAGFPPRSPSQPHGNEAELHPVRIKSFPGRSSFNLGHNHCSSTSRYVLWLKVASAKKKEACTFVFDTAKNMFTFGKLQITCTTTCDCSVPQMWIFFLFTFPARWKVVSSLKIG